MASLIDKSLVRRMDGFDGEPRFTMLETIREFGLEQLVATGEETLVREAHVAWVVALAEQAQAGLLGREQVRWLKHLEVELPNLRAALGWLEQTGDATTRLLVAGAIWPFWYIRGHLSEGRAWIEEALTPGEDIADFSRTRALFAVSMLAFGQADYQVALEFAEGSLAIARTTGDERSIALSLSMRGLVLQMQGDYERSVIWLEEALALWRQVSDRLWVGIILSELGEVVAGLCDLDRAAALHEEALVLLRQHGGPWSTAQTLTCLGLIVLDQGDTARAEELFQECVSSLWEIDDRWFIGHALAGLAMTAERQGQPQRAARLIGAVEAVCDAVHASLVKTPAQVERYEHTIDAVRAQLGDEAFAAARAAGRAMPLAEAVSEAMVVTPHAPDDPLHPLSPGGKASGDSTPCG